MGQLAPLEPQVVRLVIEAGIGRRGWPSAQKAIEPGGRLVAAREDACFAAYLCSDAANCFVGQVFPVCGGWVPR